MELKELKKLQEKLKKDQEVLNKAQVILVDDQKALKAALDLLAKDQKTLIINRDNLASEHELLADDRKALESEKERLGPLSVIEPVEKEAFNPKWLKDLVFRGRKEGKPIEKPGRKAKLKTFVPFERPMTVEDVLSFRVNGNEVVFVTADGQKRTAKK